MATIRKRIPNCERKRISQERLRELLGYDPETGVFVRIAASRPQTAYWIGKPVGYIKPGSASSGGGYHMITLDGRAYRAHHLAHLYMTGEWPAGDLDHEDTDRANNRWANLRPATRSQNIANSRLACDNLSGVKGVSFDGPRGKWKAQIGIGWNKDRGYYNTKFLGRYDTKEEAAEAYRIAAVKRFGEFARTT